MATFELIKIKNCRRFYKYCYTLSKPIDNNLLDKLTFFGLVERTNFSRYSPSFKDTFKVRLDDQIEINGTILDRQLYLTVNKEYIYLQDSLESILNEI